MKTVQEYVNGIFQNGEAIKASEMKKAYYADFLQSGIMLFNNDSTAPFVQDGNLLDVLDARIREGELGYTTSSLVDQKQQKYTADTKRDKKLTYSYGVRLSKVGTIEETYSTFLKAIKRMGEVSEDNQLKLPAKKAFESRMLTPQEVLVVENMVRLEEMFKDTGVHKKNKDAVCSVATILLLRALAKEKEENKIDNLAEQLFPYVQASIKNVKGKYVGDAELYSAALKLAKKRLSQINQVLELDEKSHVNLECLRADERMFAELNKTTTQFRDYRINFYNIGANLPISCIDKNGDFSLCNAENTDYSLFVQLNRKLFDSPIDTDEEVLQAMFLNLYIINHADKFSEENRGNLYEQLQQAFGIPCVQAMNKLGDEKSNALVQEAIENFLARAKADSSLKEILDQMLFNESGYQRKVEQTKVEEEKTVRIPAKRTEPYSVEEIRKKLANRLRKEAEFHLADIGNDKYKCKGRDKGVVITALNEIKVKLEKLGADLVSDPTAVSEKLNETYSFANGAISIFAELYLTGYSEGISNLSLEDQKQAFKQATEDIKAYYNEAVRKSDLGKEELSEKKRLESDASKYQKVVAKEAAAKEVAEPVDEVVTEPIEAVEATQETERVERFIEMDEMLGNDIVEADILPVLEEQNVEKALPSVNEGSAVIINNATGDTAIVAGEGKNVTITEVTVVKERVISVSSATTDEAETIETTGSTEKTNVEEGANKNSDDYAEKITNR